MIQWNRPLSTWGYSDLYFFFIIIKEPYFVHACIRSLSSSTKKEPFPAHTVKCVHCSVTHILSHSPQRCWKRRQASWTSLHTLYKRWIVNGYWDFTSHCHAFLLQKTKAIRRCTCLWTPITGFNHCWLYTRMFVGSEVKMFLTFVIGDLDWHTHHLWLNLINKRIQNGGRKASTVPTDISIFTTFAKVKYNSTTNSKLNKVGLWYNPKDRSHNSAHSNLN